MDYGFYADGKLLVGDYVWNDANGNGFVDGGETEYTAGIDGVLINVYRDRNNSGTVDAGDTIWTVTTTGDDPNTAGAESGWYNVGVLPGEQFLIEINDSNFAPAGPLQGRTSTTGGEVQVVNVATQNLDFDFGYDTPAAPSVTVSKTLNTPEPIRPGDLISFTIVVTNTVHIPEHKRLDKLTVLTIAPLLASAIERIHSGESVGELFR